MFDVSFTELMVIGVVALIVIGPERLPRVAKTIGHLLGRAQRYVSDVKGDIRREIELDELRRFKSEMDDAAHSVKSSLRESEASLRAPVDEVREALDQSARDARKGLNSVQDPAADAQAGAQTDPAATTLPGVTPTAAFPPADTAEASDAPVADPAVLPAPGPSPSSGTRS